VFLNKQSRDETAGGGGATSVTVTEQISVEVVNWYRILDVLCSILGNKFAYPE
jgi:hypothetical protein